MVLDPQKIPTREKLILTGLYLSKCAAPMTISVYWRTLRCRVARTLKATGWFLFHDVPFAKDRKERRAFYQVFQIGR